MSNDEGMTKFETFAGFDSPAPVWLDLRAARLSRSVPASLHSAICESVRDWRRRPAICSFEFVSLFVIRASSFVSRAID